MARIACWRIDLVIGDLGADTELIAAAIATAACDRTGGRSWTRVPHPSSVKIS
ncbi:MAG: hypothetical protein U1C73_14190 [Dietzia sp.]|nr:hypothetical protein [Dietzia sp.]